MNTPRAILGTALALAALVIALVIAFAGSVLATDAHREALPVAESAGGSSTATEWEAHSAETWMRVPGGSFIDAML